MASANSDSCSFKIFTPMPNTANQNSQVRRRGGGGATKNSSDGAIKNSSSDGAIRNGGSDREGNSTQQAQKLLTKSCYCVSYIVKFVLFVMVCLGLVRMTRHIRFSWMVFQYTRDVEQLSQKISGVENLVKTAVKGFDEKLETKGVELDFKLKKLDVSGDTIKEKVRERFEDYIKAMNSRGSDDGVTLDNIIDYVRELVVRGIEKHAADGIGMVNYALVSKGAYVLDYWEPYHIREKSGFLGWMWWNFCASNEAHEILTPSFGEPGRCLALKGSKGYVQIVLGTDIFPQAVTLEHVAKSVAYDRSNAPKQVVISGWQLPKLPHWFEIASKKFLLAEFTYDLNKSNIQTHKIEDGASSRLVNMIRLDILSNYGGDHTCIYRLRVHGHEMISVTA